MLDDRQGQGATLITSQFPSTSGMKSCRSTVPMPFWTGWCITPTDRLKANRYERQNASFENENKALSHSAYSDGPVSPLRVATGGTANWSSKVRSRRSPPARIDGAMTISG
jgi:hypothetical protein